MLDVGKGLLLLPLLVPYCVLRAGALDLRYSDTRWLSGSMVDGAEILSA